MALSIISVSGSIMVIYRYIDNVSFTGKDAAEQLVKNVKVRDIPDEEIALIKQRLEIFVQNVERLGYGNQNSFFLLFKSKISKDKDLYTLDVKIIDGEIVLPKQEYFNKQNLS
ncbi:MAG: hypothetical protein QM687_01225 [Ferruginibacter sp.]